MKTHRVVIASRKEEIAARMPTKSGFQLHVLNLQWPDLRFGYTTEDVWPILRSANLNTALLVFGETDVRTYDWTHQEIWLSDVAVRRLIDVGGHAFLSHALGHAFVVTLDGERLYGGLFYPFGAAAIQFPVIGAVGNPIVALRIRPALGSEWRPNESRYAEQHRLIANTRLAERLSQQGLIGSGPITAT